MIGILCAVFRVITKMLSTRYLGYTVAETLTGSWFRAQEGAVLKQNTNQEEWDSDMMGETNLVHRQEK